MPLEDICSAYLTARTLMNARDLACVKTRELGDDATSSSVIPRSEQNFALWLATGGQAEDIPDVILRLKNRARDPHTTDASLLFPPRLAGMLLRTRYQQCTDP